MPFIPLTQTHRHTAECAEPVNPVQIVPRRSIHDLICLFSFYSCLYFQCLSFETLILPLCLLLPNSGNPPLCTPVTQRRDVEYCHETEARERKHFSLQDPRWAPLPRVHPQGSEARIPMSVFHWGLVAARWHFITLQSWSCIFNL